MGVTWREKGQKEGVILEGCCSDSGRNRAGTQIGHWHEWGQKRRNPDLQVVEKAGLDVGEGGGGARDAA